MYCIVYDEFTGTENGFNAMEGDEWHYLKLGLGCVNIAVLPPHTDLLH
jgi:hypothetical protein